jgi:hypothetical protein
LRGDPALPARIDVTAYKRTLIARFDCRGVRRRSAARPAAAEALQHLSAVGARRAVAESSHAA